MSTYCADRNNIVLIDSYARFGGDKGPTDIRADSFEKCLSQLRGDRRSLNHGGTPETDATLRTKFGPKRQRTGPLERSIAKPEEVSSAVLYLASDRAGFVTGQVFTVDGGTLL